MNKERRKAIDEIAAKWHKLEDQRQALAFEMEVLRDDLQELCDEEQGALDNLPQSIAESETGAEMQTNIETIENAINQMEELIDGLQDDSAYDEPTSTLEDLPT